MIKTILIVSSLIHPVASSDNACLLIAKMAEVAMSGRQAGISLESVLENSKKTITNKNMRKMMRTLIIGAYQRPRFYSNEMQQRAIDDYRDKAQVTCLTASE